MTLFVLLSVLSTSFAFAGDEPAVPAPAPAVAADDDDDFFSEKKPENLGANAGMPDGNSFKDDDELNIPQAPPPEAKVIVKPPPEAEPGGGMPLLTADQKPLNDNWAPAIVITQKDAVVIEMPVLYGLNKKEFDGVAFWLVAEVWADGKKVAESRTNVTRDSIADKGPSIQFFRMFTPVAAPSGVLEVKVSKVVSTGKPELLFTRSVKYALGA